MRVLRRLVNPYTWIKIFFSSLALYVNAIQLSEVSDADGQPLRGHRGDWYERATLVAFEARQNRRHLGLVK